MSARPASAALGAGFAFAGLAAAAISACGEIVTQPIGAAPSDGGSFDVTVEASLDGGPPTDAPALFGDTSADAPFTGGGDAASFCSGHGPTLPGFPALCTGDLANLFRFAACACSAFDVSGVLTTSAVDPAIDAGVPAGSIGANVAVTTNSSTNVRGSLWAGGQGLTGGAPAVSLSGPSPNTISKDLQSGGPTQVGGAYEVLGNLASNGDVTLTGSGTLTVGGTVQIPPGDTATGVTAPGGGPAVVAYSTVNVPPPCDCSKLSASDIGNIIDGFASTNDDSAIHLSTTALDDPGGTVQLPCGLYWVDGIHGGNVTIEIDGRVALFVGGDMSVDQALTIQFGNASAELDLFVKGNVVLESATQPIVVGDVASPARTRIYVGGSPGGNDAGGGFVVSASVTIAANVYAPAAVVQLASNFDMRGAIVAQGLQFSGDFAITYDTSILQVPATNGCQPGGGGCTTCNDCAGSTPACIAGKCTGCKFDSDCCPPLQCNTATGVCVQPTQ